MKFHFDASVGVLVLGYVVYCKIVDHRMRSASARVAADVAKVSSHRHCMLYFVRYRWKGVERTATFCGSPFRRSHEPGDKVEILVEPDLTPDVAIPEGFHNQPNAGLGGGTCVLAGTRLVSLVDVFYFLGALALMIRSCM